jgi:MFS family permease
MPDSTPPPPVPPAPQCAANVPRLYAFRFLRDFLLIMPAIVPVYLACGLGPAEILLVQAIFSAAALAFEVPSGYLADVVGRRRALLLGSACMTLGLGGYALADRFLLFAAAEVVLAFGYSLMSGTESALLFDSLQAAGTPARYRRLEGRAEALTRLGTAGAAVLGGLLAGVALRLPFVVNVGTAAVMVLLAASLVEPPRRTLDGRAPVREVLRIFRETVADRRLQPALLLSAALFATGVVGIWGYFLRLTGTGIGVLSYGAYFAAFQAASAAGAVGAERLVRWFGPRGVYAVLLAVPGALVACAASPAAWPVLLTPLAAAAWGCSTPLLLAVLNRRLPSDRRATVLSINALGGRVLFVLLGPAFGLLAERVSDRAAFAALAGAFVALAAAAAALLRRAGRPPGDATTAPGSAKPEA